MKLLIGDIGGTKTLLQIVEFSDSSLKVIRQQRYASAAFNDFESVLNTFLAQTDSDSRHSLRLACFAVAGPIIRQQARVTNLPWRLDALSLAANLGLQQVRLINDFQAIAHGIELLNDDDFVELQAGREDPRGTRVVVGAGTGLGQCIMVRGDDRQTIAIASEGGHMDFAPVNEMQWGLHEHLKKQFNRVTYEHLVSGPGLTRIYAFLHTEGYDMPSAQLQTAMQNGDPAEAISHFALTDQDKLAAKALEMFISLYGAYAGNLALSCLATGGVFIAGGIAPKMIDRLRQGDFMMAFCDKEPMADVLKAMPVRVVMNEHAGLLGAARVAADHERSRQCQ